MPMYMRGAAWLVFLVFASLFFHGRSAVHATTVEKITFSEAVERAEIIAVGKVTIIEETWDVERALPFTEVTFSVLEVLKGEVGAELTLQFLGGQEPDGLTLEVAGMPRFEIGDRTVVFSAGNGVYACPLVGWWQGLYRVLYDLETMDWVVADHAGRPVVAIDGMAGRLRVRLAEAASDAHAFDAHAVPDPLTLNEFTALVRTGAR